MKEPKIAFIHDWLVTYAGAERVLERMLAAFPEAHIFSTVDFLEGSARDFVAGHTMTTSFIQNLPRAKKSYRQYLPLMPIAVEQFNLSQFDIIISSSHAVAKGILAGPDQLHICMCYSPIRYAWDLQHQYLKEANLERGIKSLAARSLLHYIRLWDIRTVPGVDLFISISQFISDRIEKVYKRPSLVIYPPVDVDGFTPDGERADFYMTASRMVPYKRIDLIVDAFSKMPDKRLIVIGDGPEMEKIRALATPNVEIMGYQTFDVMRDRMRKAKAFIFAAEEDFGIAPIEAQACGTPVIAFGKGGALETIIDGETGLFFLDQTARSLMDAVFKFENLGPEAFSSDACRKNSERFSAERFDWEFSRLMETILSKWERKRGLESIIPQLTMQFREADK